MVAEQIEAIKNWRFLDEPIYRWAIFMLAMSVMLNTWRYVTGMMK